MQVSIQVEKINITNILTENKEFCFCFSGHKITAAEQNFSLSWLYDKKNTVISQTQNNEKKASLNSIVFKINVDTSMYSVRVWCEYMYIKLKAK